MLNFYSKQNLKDHNGMQTDKKFFVRSRDIIVVLSVLKHAERTFSEKLRFEQCSADLDKVPDFLGSQARFHHLPLCSAQVQPTLRNVMSVDVAG